MEHDDTATRLAAAEAKLELIYQSTERTRKYIMGAVIMSGIGFLIPLVGLLFAIPVFLNSYSSLLSL